MGAEARARSGDGRRPAGAGGRGRSDPRLAAGRRARAAASEGREGVTAVTH